MSKFKHGGQGHSHPKGRKGGPKTGRDGQQGDRTEGESASRRKGGGPPPGHNWLYGLHAVAAAIANPARKLRRLVATTEAAATLAGQVSGGPAPELLSREEISRLLPADAVHQGVALLADPLEDLDVDDILREIGPDRPALFVVLDQATDPRNVGAVLRSAGAFGAAALIMPDRNAAAPGGGMAKAASGALERVPVVRPTNLSRALKTLQEAGFWCVGLSGHATTRLAEVDLTGRIAVVLGSEGKGLRRLTAETCDVLARIPMDESTESLNLSAAAAVTLYEVARQRGL